MIFRIVLSRFVVVAGFFATLLGLLSAAAASDRIALIIGNGAYVSVPALVQPNNDAADIAAAFDAVGFDVTRFDDLDGRAMRRALRDFEAQTDDASVAVIYFSGHGLAVDGVNYLLPVDAKLERDSHVDDEGVPLSRLISAVEDADHLRLVMLDAARRNPWITAMRRSPGGHVVAPGLVRIPPVDATVVFSTREGATVDDADKHNGAMAESLMVGLDQPETDLETFLRRVRDNIVATTDGRQESLVIGPTTAPVLVVPDAETVAMLSRPAPATAGPVRDGQLIDMFGLVDQIGTVESWDVFLQRCTAAEIDNLYCGAARLIRRALIENGAGSDGWSNTLGEGAGSGGDDTSPPPKAVISGEGAAARCDRLAGHALDADKPGEIDGVSMVSLALVADAAIDACTRAAETDPGARRHAFALGRALQAAGRGDEAAEWYARAAEAGSVAAMANLAALYRAGHGVERDPALAREWFAQAVEGGNVAAMNALGTLYLDGAGGPARFERARALFEQAVAAGDSTGMVNLGRLYNYGRGVEIDHARARALYERAAALGDGEAMLSLARMAAGDQGGPWDDGAGIEWYERAAAVNHAGAMTRLGMSYRDGLGVAADIDEAIRWFEAAIALGDPTAMTMYGALHSRGNGVAQDIAAARDWYAKAGAAGHSPAMASLGYLLANGYGGEIDYAAALDWYRRGAALANGNAMANLGFMYESGWGVDQNYAEALAWYVRAAEAGNAVGMANAALLYENGRGAEENLPEAFRWYSHAAEAGNVQGMASLGFFYSNGLGTAIDDAAALHWYTRASDLGNTVAMHNLGVAYKDGLGTEVDYDRAVDLFVRAMEAGNTWTFSQFRDQPDNYPVEVMTQIERYLVEQGYLAGEPDGVVDADTRAALDALQADVGA